MAKPKTQKEPNVTTRLVSRITPPVGTQRAPELKLAEPSIKLRLSAPAPSDDMRPGEYLAKCEDCWPERHKGKIRIIWQFVIHEGQHHGVGMRKWKALDGERVAPNSELARACEIALGRSVKDTDLSDLSGVFSGKIFKIIVGYRKTATSKGGDYSDENIRKKKDEKDKLRVHDILTWEQML